MSTWTGMTCMTALASRTERNATRDLHSPLYREGGDDDREAADLRDIHRNP